MSAEILSPIDQKELAEVRATRAIRTILDNSVEYSVGTAERRIQDGARYFDQGNFESPEDALRYFGETNSHGSAQDRVFVMLGYLARRYEVRGDENV